jgi:CheY-like chemotaxis protein
LTGIFDEVVRRSEYPERHGFEVTIANGGEAGLRALEGAAFDLMIVDIFVPHLRGFESVRIFHERAPAIPLIAMSGDAFANLDSPAPDFLRMAFELGAARCLRKPFTPMALLAVINECLASMSVSPKSVPASQALFGSHRRLGVAGVVRAARMLHTSFRICLP